MKEKYIFILLLVLAIGGVTALIVYYAVNGYWSITYNINMDNNTLDAFKSINYTAVGNQ